MVRLRRLLHMIPLRLRALLRRGEVERELAEEFEYYVEERTRREMARGVSAEEARAAARRALDGQARQMEACRETWGVTFLDHLGRDLRTGVRGWRRTPGLWALATITLGVGLGANATIFSVVDVIYHHPLSGLDPERYAVLEAFQEK
ncbi:MAG: hypothetical protein JNK48_11615, partial [Bryobacterales bacterium]|nr:hypothetical protein [Bryobacterales bacterium]